MRTTWDAAATSGVVETYVGDPATARRELDGLFGRLGDDPRGGTCVEVGCGPGRMTPFLAERFDRVIAVDVSPAMLDLARERVKDERVEFRPVSGSRLETVEGGAADALVCYLVLQHLPDKRVVLSTLAEFGRVLAAEGRVYAQLPVLGPGLRPRLWRWGRSVAVPIAGRLSADVARQSEYRGFRLTAPELEAGLAAAGLRVTARDESPESPYRYAREVFLRLEQRSS
jgi:ubiquinone/menaquinone biosynthesis C-methylase UbiE